jgi:diguanylate cyclase (GGDEF)-like protein
MLGSKLFDEQNGCLAILRPSDQYLEVAVCWGDSDFMEANFFLSDCWALRRGQVHIVPDPQTGLMCTHFSQPVQSGYLCVPLMVQGETLGMLCITNLDEKRLQRQQQLAVIVGDSIKLSLSNLKLREKLREQALTDQLTGLGNRHYLEGYLSRELSRTLRRDASVCIAMLDLDHFKDFNDTYGHDAGDMLLHKLGDLLRNNLRQSDLKCRYGGEEFVIVLIDSPFTEVRERLEKIRELVKTIEIQHGKDRFGGVTLSIGLVEAHERDWTTSRLLRAADEALYAAKQAGRDRIVVYPATD